MKQLFTTMSIALLGLLASAQQEQDSIQQVALQEVFVSAIRADKKMAVSYTNVKAAELASRNLGQDLPILLNYLPGVVTTSDAGAGIGYTGIRVRGSDATRVNVTINGIPYNDAESQGVYWVDLPDFATSVSSLQLQRGVGTSTNGAGAFGASLNLSTSSTTEDFSGMLRSSIGSYNTFNTSLSFNTKAYGGFSFSGRFSTINSDGYIDRATSDLKSYFVQGAFRDENTHIKALVFGGHERTYQAWYGVDSATLEQNRTTNYAGYYIDENGQEQFYEDQVDDYLQNHMQLIWNQDLNQGWSSNIALHFTHGEGYYEEYNEDGSSDTITQKWLDNNFYGTVFSVQRKEEKSQLIIGGGWNRYDGSHFGLTLWAQGLEAANLANPFYDTNSLKTDTNFYLKYRYDLDEHWSTYVDIQNRWVGYQTNLKTGAQIDDQFNFFNPKAGITYTINPSQHLYGSYAKAQREPNRTDYKTGSPKPESLDDFELGYRFLNSKAALNVNLFYMNYKDQLVLTGALNEVGAPIRENIGSSYRAGIELDASIQLTDQFRWMPNISISKHRNRDFFFERNGVLEALGATHIAFSPELIIGNILSYIPIDQLNLSLMTKHVSEQYMGNIDSKNSLLEAYTISDFNLSYTIPNHWELDLQLQLLVNNIFDVNYVSNGYFYTYDDTWSTAGATTTMEGAGYYPQATRNFLVGAVIGW